MGEHISLFPPSLQSAFSVHSLLGEPIHFLHHDRPLLLFTKYDLQLIPIDLIGLSNSNAHSEMRVCYNQKGKEKAKKKKKGTDFSNQSLPPEHFTQGTTPCHFFPDIIG